MKCPPEFWIWLQRSLGAGKRLNKIISYYGAPVTLYEEGRKSWTESGVLTKSDITALSEYSPSQSYDVIKQCADNGWKIVTFDDDNYPPLLRETYGYPAVLYVWGDVSVLTSKVCIGIVGTRNASDYGICVAESLSKSLASSGAVIVSGGALGVDKSAHRGAVMAGGKTIAILGNGLGHSYLSENEKMRRVISENGAVISEYLPFTPPSKRTFPIRNRLISGMSLGTVVIEAGEKSGSLITAKCALEQGRDVFAVPGDVMSSGYFGTNALIRDGARAVFSAMDVLDSYIDEYGKYLTISDGYEPLRPITSRTLRSSNDSAKQRNTTDISKTQNRKKENRQKTKSEKQTSANNKREENKTKVQSSLPSFASENAKIIFNILSQEPKLTDELVEMSGLAVQDVLASLTELEMYSVVTMLSGKRYALVTD